MPRKRDDSMPDTTMKTPTLPISTNTSGPQPRLMLPKNLSVLSQVLKDVHANMWTLFLLKSQMSWRDLQETFSDRYTSGVLTSATVSVKDPSPLRARLLTEWDGQKPFLIP